VQLDARSMAATGAAGSLVVAITNALAQVVTAVAPATLALALSFLAGLVSVRQNSEPAWRMAVFYVLASLSIFAAAAGTNQLGRVAIERAEPLPALISAAWARDQTPTPVPTPIEQRVFPDWYNRRSK
jgi:hypothetical protein